ncbi:glycosyltransferase [Marinifilum sp.]|uniref:glycosyltransferase n=1 Tax=Marinifilum sp. TaxID=2033137 RepID=UPI003BA91E96
MKLSNKKRLLILTSRFPYPHIGGDKVRVYNFIKLLSQKYEIDLVSLSDESIRQENIVEMEKYCKQVKVFSLSKKMSFLKTFIGLFNKQPLQVNYYYSKQLQCWVDANVERYSGVFCYHIRTTKYLEKHKNLFRVVDFVDAISMNCLNSIKTSNGFSKQLYKMEYRKCLRYENEIIKEFNKVAIISEVDRSIYTRNVDFKKIEIVGNYVPEIITSNTVQESSNSICFFGKMNYKPNIDAVKFFVSEIFPTLKLRNKNLILKVVGAHPTQEIMDLADQDGVHITGFVDNPYNLIKESDVVIAPMISGSGIQNKILESMMLGKCVITSKIGAEGLKVQTEKELIICKTKNDYLDKIELCLNDRNYRDSIGSNAKLYIENNFSENMIKKQLFKLIDI